MKSKRCCICSIIQVNCPHDSHKSAFWHGLTTSVSLFHSSPDNLNYFLPYIPDPRKYFSSFIKKIEKYRYFHAPLTINNDTKAAPFKRSCPIDYKHFTHHPARIVKYVQE